MVFIILVVTVSFPLLHLICTWTWTWTWITSTLSNSFEVIKRISVLIIWLYEQFEKSSKKKNFFHLTTLLFIVSELALFSIKYTGSYDVYTMHEVYIADRKLALIAFSHKNLRLIGEQNIMMRHFASLSYKKNCWGSGEIVALCFSSICISDAEVAKLGRLNDMCI